MREQKWKAVRCPAKGLWSTQGNLRRRLLKKQQENCSLSQHSHWKKKKIYQGKEDSLYRKKQLWKQSFLFFTACPVAMEAGFGVSSYDTAHLRLAPAASSSPRWGGDSTFEFHRLDYQATSPSAAPESRDVQRYSNGRSPGTEPQPGCRPPRSGGARSAGATRRPEEARQWRAAQQRPGAAETPAPPRERRGGGLCCE